MRSAERNVYVDRKDAIWILSVHAMPGSEPECYQELSDSARGLIEANGCRQLVVDLQHLEGVAHRALLFQTLVHVQNAASDAGGRMRVCGVNDGLWSVVLDYRLDGVLEFDSDVQAAIDSLSR